MAIHAQKTTFRPGTQSPDFSITTPQQGQILVYDHCAGAFVNKAPACIVPDLINTLCNVYNICPGGSGGGGGGTGLIDGAINVGTGTGVFQQTIGTDLAFRTLKGESGISLGVITGNNNEILFTNDIITQSQISVPGSFKIEIDNDNTTYDTALFEIWTKSSLTEVTFTPARYTSSNLDITVVADPHMVNKGQFISSTANFINLGFVAGMSITVVGTNEQDGTWILDNVTSSTLTITVPFPNVTDAGLQPPTTFSGPKFDFITTQTMSFPNYNWSNAGFIIGTVITISGSHNNDGNYTIAALNGDVLTIVEHFPTTGFDGNNITVATPVQDHPTGWWVNELGEMRSNSASICGDLNVICDGNLNVDGDVRIGGELYVDGHTIEDLIISLQPSVPGTGFLVQTGPQQYVARSITNGSGIIVTNGDGVHGNTQISAGDFTIQYEGDVTGFTTVHGLQNTVTNLSLTNIGVGGSYNKVTVNGKGLVVGGTNQEISAGPGITVINGDGVMGDPIIIANDFELSFIGDVSGHGLVHALSDLTVSLFLPEIIQSGTYNEVTVDTKGRVVFGINNTNLYQPLDEDLSDLAGGLPTPGYTVWNGFDYVSRVIQGTPDEIIVTDGAATNSDTILSLSDNPNIPGFGALVLPKGVTSQRSLKDMDGAIRYNYELQQFEGRANGTWEAFTTAPVSGLYLSITGGTMMGDINMSTHNIITSGLIDGRDVSVDGDLLDAINTGLGIKVQISPNTFVNRTIRPELNSPITVNDGNGVAGDPTVGFDLTQLPDLGIGEVVDQDNDMVVLYDESTNQHVKATVRQLNNRDAQRYFWAQF